VFFSSVDAVVTSYKGNRSTSLVPGVLARWP